MSEFALINIENNFEPAKRIEEIAANMESGEILVESRSPGRLQLTERFFRELPSRIPCLQLERYTHRPDGSYEVLYQVG